jgi:hypothetical protein
LGSADEGAKVAVETCMAVKKGEHVLILTDKSTLDVGVALRDAAERTSIGNVKMLLFGRLRSTPYQRTS